MQNNYRGTKCVCVKMYAKMKQYSNIDTPIILASNFLCNFLTIVNDYSTYLDTAILDTFDITSMMLEIIIIIYSRNRTCLRKEHQDLNTIVVLAPTIYFEGKGNNLMVVHLCVARSSRDIYAKVKIKATPKVRLNYDEFHEIIFE